MQKEGECAPARLELATAGADGAVWLWSVRGQRAVGQLQGHTRRVSQIAFHPDGRLLGSCAYDLSWRLWDLETRQEILLQEGHSQEVSVVIVMLCVV